jgi:hypothetical protein
VSGLLKEPGAEEEAPAVLASYLDPLPDWGALVEALTAGWGEVVGGRTRRDEPTAGELERASVLTSRYADLAWTFRR